MGSLALRRTKTSRGPDGSPLVALPPKSVAVVQLQLAAQDAEHYTRLEQETKSLVCVCMRGRREGGREGQNFPFRVW